jgi:hypothetical protein
MTGLRQDFATKPESQSIREIEAKIEALML